MIFRLFRQSEAKSGASTPEGTVVYAVGDIHGHLGLLVKLQAEIAADMAGRDADRRVVVYLGDYIDRGPDSRGVISHLIRRPIEGAETVHLAGNHDRWMLRFLDDVSVARSWLMNGGSETLMSYGISMPHALDANAFTALQQSLRKAMPSAHRAFLEGLKFSHEEGGYFFVHAGVRPGVALADQKEEDLIWIREEFLFSSQDFGKVVVHGHTPTHTPEKFANRIGIDTGAFATGKLTAAVLAGSKQRFLHT
jgi:serine/threonine protein phosphatase 1